MILAIWLLVYSHVFLIDKLGASQYQKLLVFDETRYSDVFEIADYEYELRIYKFKMAGAIWQTRIKKSLDLDKTEWFTVSLWFGRYLNLVLP